jgi:hypothetical protein
VASNAPSSGIQAVVRAEQRLLAGLDRLPTALNLRRIIDSQRALSHHLARRVTDDEPESSSKWAERATTYTHLFAQTRNLGGLVGDGAAAAAAGATALTHLREVPGAARAQPGAIRSLDTLFDRIDARVADAIERGLHTNIYLAKTATPESDTEDGHIVHSPRAAFVPVTVEAQGDLLALVRGQLRRRPAGRDPSAHARQHRLEFEAALNHRPGEHEALGPFVGH